MARGKAAAQSANRRLTEAAARIAQLQQAATERDKAHQAEVADLKQQLSKAQNRLLGDAAAIAKREVFDATERARTQIQDMERQHIARVRAGWTMLDKLTPDGIGLTGGVDSYAQVAEAFGVALSDLMSSTSNRRSRRTSNRRAHNIAVFAEEVERSGRPVLGGAFND